MTRATGKLLGLFAAAGLLYALAGPASGQHGMHGQKGMQGPMHCHVSKGDTTWAADSQTLSILLTYRKYIKRQVTNRSDGVETVTESSNAALAAKIQEHAEAMQARLKEGRAVNFNDPLFAAVFRNAAKIKMVVERTKKGVRVTETSDDPYVAKLIQAHARVVSLYVKNGQAEVMKSHAAPKAVYACPMHPEVVRDRPGNCPTCGMLLTQHKGDTKPDKHHHH
jgi:uncharacterized protein